MVCLKNICINTLHEGDDDDDDDDDNNNINNNNNNNTISVIKTNQLILYRELITVCSVIHTQHTNTLCGQNVAFLIAKPGGTYRVCPALKG
jgi:hypothetical protein